MIPILNTKQTKEADKECIRSEPIKSIDLMERASSNWLEKLRSNLNYKNNYVVIAGAGNNGGDGLAIARLLYEELYSVDVYILKRNKYTKDNTLNQKRLATLNISFQFIDNESDFPKINLNTVVIDALFGSGLQGNITGIEGKLIHYLNDTNSRIWSVDIPSGLFADAHTNSKTIIKAERTVCFQQPKLSFLLPESWPYTGIWDMVNIGLHKDFINSLNTQFYCVDFHHVVNILVQPPFNVYKNKLGHALVIGGNTETEGAIQLCANACLNSGTGLTSTFALSNSKHSNVLKSVMNLKALPNKLSKFCIGLGPGLGQTKHSLETLKYVLAHANQPLVLDADALNLLALNNQLIEQIPVGSILTPHPGELRRLIGTTANSFEELETAQSFAQEHKITLIIKRPFTAIINQHGKVVFNLSGNNGLATAGSGDVLTGIITGLLAQGYSTENAAIIGVYVHGLAADMLRNTHNRYFTADKLVKTIPKAFKLLTAEVN